MASSTSLVTPNLSTLTGSPTLIASDKWFITVLVAKPMSIAVVSCQGKQNIITITRFSKIKIRLYKSCITNYSLFAKKGQYGLEW